MTTKTETLASAMAAAFGEIDAATKSASNPHFKSKYADLTAVIDAIRPALVKHGLFFTQRPEPNERGVLVHTFLHHASGEQMELGALFVPANKNDAQGFGSALTYARRYALVTAFGVPTEDDDGNAAVKSKAKAEDEPEQYAFPEGPATGITQLKAMARELYRAINACETKAELDELTLPECNADNAALLKQMAALENPQHREIWEGDGKDNPGLAGLITAKEYQFARQIADLATV